MRIELTNHSFADWYLTIQSPTHNFGGEYWIRTNEPLDMVDGLANRCLKPNSANSPIMAEAVRFELTEHFCSSVFKTGAINRTLPHFHKFGRGYKNRTCAKNFKGSCATITPIPNKSIQIFKEL